MSNVQYSQATVEGVGAIALPWRPNSLKIYWRFRVLVVMVW
ncbi:hypothetical protein [Nostoc sp.]